MNKYMFLNTHLICHFMCAPTTFYTYVYDVYVEVYFYFVKIVGKPNYMRN